MRARERWVCAFRYWNKFTRIMYVSRHLGGASTVRSNAVGFKFTFSSECPSNDCDARSGSSSAAMTRLKPNRQELNWPGTQLGKPNSCILEIGKRNTCMSARDMVSRTIRIAAGTIGSLWPEKMMSKSKQEKYMALRSFRRPPMFSP